MTIHEFGGLEEMESETEFDWSGSFTQKEIVSLFSVVVSQKPVADIEVVIESSAHREWMDGVIDDFCEMYSVEWEHNWFPEAEQGRWKCKYMVASSEEQFQEVEGVQSDLDEWNRGKLFGYPREAVEAYCGRERWVGLGYARKFEEFLSECLSGGVISVDECGFLGFVNWVPAQSVSSVRVAVARGWRYMRDLLLFAEAYGLRRLRWLVLGMYAEARAEYSNG